MAERKKRIKSARRRDPALKGDEVIACRTYAIDGSAPTESITVKIGKPRLRGADGRYECGAEITESGRRWVRYVNGVDAIEALQLALVLIGTDMKHLDKQLNGALSWLDGTRRDLALPVPPNFSLYPIISFPVTANNRNSDLNDPA